MSSQRLLNGFTGIFAVSCGVFLLSNLSVKVEAQPSSAAPRRESQKVAIRYRPPAGQGKPKATVGGGTRTTCFLDEEQPKPPLTLLIPGEKLGLTTRQHPQFFVYVPQTSAKEAEFLLRDANGEYQYRARYSLPETSGIVKVELPDSATALEEGKDYQWMFAIICDPDSRDRDVVDMGAIKLTELSPTQKSQLEQAEPLKRAALYAEYGIWHDAVETLASLQCSESNHQNQETWRQLLQSQPLLDSIATQPLIECGTRKITR
ncbi:DUF928 domain-containing protein [Capilliphycus salinus ALCB114379]|uniref:DUF928 domain-containing protein n=1 Tax=Capilliphycus salinus TaxID=2768948 RepID=UPI0039A4A3A0